MPIQKEREYGGDNQRGYADRTGGGPQGTAVDLPWRPGLLKRLDGEGLQRPGYCLPGHLGKTLEPGGSHRIGERLTFEFVSDYDCWEGDASMNPEGD